MKKCLLLLSLMLVLSVVIAANLDVTLASTQNILRPSQSNHTSISDTPSLALAQRADQDEAIIADHTTTDITTIPQYWIEEAKRTLHIGYGHTSHGSQLASGMTGLVGFANNSGLGLSLPNNIFQFSHNGNSGGDYLHLFEGDGYGTGDLDHDCGYYPNWVNETQDYLGTPTAEGMGSNHPEINIIIWSWCGQASGRTEETMLSTYLTPMSQLEAQYTGVTFVYMTGHADGTGEEGNLHARNQQIRDYVMANNKVLFDFYDIELYNPDGDYFGDKLVNDQCYYDSDGNGSRDANWAIEWQNSHTEGEDWFNLSYCAHSQPLNCNQKAYAVWWLWARLAGWDGQTAEVVDLETSKSVSQTTAGTGDQLDYTVVVRNAPGPLASTVYLTDTIPAGLAYVPGSLSITSGISDTSSLPTIHWTGTLSPTAAVTLTYAVTVTEAGANALTNTAEIGLPGEPNMTSSTTVIVNGTSVYLPLTLK